MRLGTKLVLAIIAGGVSLSASAQGTFQDLDFEGANPSAAKGGNNATVLFPGWQLNSPNVAYDPETLGVPFIAISGTDYGDPVLQGNYSALLASANGFSTEVSVAISQTGLVPNGSESIEFEANELNSGSFVVTFDGDPITMVPLQRFPNYTLYGGDVSAWAGQDTTLSITQLAPPTPSGLYSPSLLQLDNITFSPTQVAPEPSPIALMTIGGLLFTIYRRFGPKPR